MNPSLSDKTPSGKTPASGKIDFEQALIKVDLLLQQNNPQTIDAQGTALGIKLALIMGREIRDQKALGVESAPLIAKWMKEYGEAQTESAISMARNLLLKPHLLQQELELRLRR